MCAQQAHLVCLSVFVFASACAVEDSDDTTNAVEDGIMIDGALVHVQAIASPMDSTPEASNEPTGDDRDDGDIGMETSRSDEPTDDLEEADINVAGKSNVRHHLTYHGGLLIPEVRVHPVFWNNDTQHQNSLDAMYKGITNSALFDMLGQYSKPRRLLIVRGSATKGFVDDRHTERVSDRDIRRELNRLFSRGLLPRPGDNTYYPIHFPPGVVIDGPGNSGGTSCADFCGYHYAYRRNGVNVYYGVIPDHGGRCTNRCGRGTRVENLDSTSSHELVEAVTDPAASLGSVGWTDRRTGQEIGDICNQRHGKIRGGDGQIYIIQKEFSNVDGECVTH